MTRAFGSRLAILAAGVLIGAATNGMGRPAPAVLPPKIAVVLHRFDIQPGKQDKFDEWINFLHANQDAAVTTLDREKTYLRRLRI